MSHGVARAAAPRRWSPEQELRETPAAATTTAAIRRMKPYKLPKPISGLWRLLWMVLGMRFFVVAYGGGF